MSLQRISPEGWPRPRGYSDAVVAPADARLVFVSGQIAWDERQRIIEGGFVAQLRQALANVVAVVRAAGGGPEHVASMTIFVVDKQQYCQALKPAGEAWREVMGKHYPAMALVEVKGLVEPGALVEVQAIAAIPPDVPPAMTDLV